MMSRAAQPHSLPRLDAAHGLVDRLAATQSDALEEAAWWCADAITADGPAHLSVVGDERSRALFDEAYREHARRLARAIIQSRGGE
jgi:hypothetical protein